MKKLWIAILLLLITVNGYSAVPHTFANGTVADATEMNDDMDYFENKFSTSGGHDHDGSDSKYITVLGTLQSALTVQGITTLNGAINLNNDVTATGDLVAAGTFTIGGKTTTTEINVSTLTASQPVFSSSTGDLVSVNPIPIANGGTNSTSTTYCNLTSNVIGTLPVGNGGTGATAASNAANGVVVLDASAYVPDASVDTTALKTATSEVGGADGSYTATGGQYCHYPQIKAAGTAGYAYIANYTPNKTSYITNISMNMENSGYAIFRYHTASGEDYWLFLLVDKNTKDVLAMSGAPDHPAYGNSNDFNKQPHPFPSYDANTQDIVLIEKMQAKVIQTEAKDKGLSVLELVDRDYKIDFTQTYPYVPIHSGQFSPEHTPVLVESIPNYIQVRKLVLATDKDKSDKVKLQADKQKACEDKKVSDKNKKQAILDKLKITKEDLELILK